MNMIIECSPTVSRQHPPQLAHTNAITAKKHIQRHCSSNIFLNLRHHAPRSFFLFSIPNRQEVLEQARLLHLQPTAALQPHFGTVYKRYPTPNESIKLPPSSLFVERPKCANPIKPSL